jgi:hypothetical protein
MIELADAGVMGRREDLAGRVRDELAAAGLPIVAPTMNPHIETPGAEVRVDKLVDCHAPVRVDWHTDRALREAFHRAAMAQQIDAPAFRHYELVIHAMLRTMTEILTAAGFTVRDSTNDFAPLTLEILDGPRGAPPWGPY